MPSSISETVYTPTVAPDGAGGGVRECWEQRAQGEQGGEAEGDVGRGDGVAEQQGAPVAAEAAGEASHAGKDDWMCSEQDDPPDQGGQADQGGAGPDQHASDHGLGHQKAPAGERAASAGTGD